ncbi:Sds3-like-domain-containing protein [Chiua virens]|nr:Sds3-like-domain-containing protein [Chiua virens]
MSHSVSPLGSLSSPSPSPPPDPIESELSELTDDDNDDDDDDPSHSDNDDDQHPPPRSRKTPSSSSANSRRRQRRRHLTGKSLPASRSANPPSSSKRKKRGGLVPAPMWDWAYKNGANGSPSSTPAPHPPLSPPANTPSLPGPSRPPDPDSEHGSRPPFKLKQRSPTPDAEEEEEEELPTPPRAMEEEEAEDADSRKDRPQDRKSSRHTLSSKFMLRKMTPPIDYGKLIPRSKRGLRVMPRISWHQNNRMMKRMWEKGEKLWDPNAPTSDEDGGTPTERRAQASSDSSNSEDEEMGVDDDPEDQVRTSPRLSPARPTLNTNLKPTSLPTSCAVDQAADIPSLPPSIRASVDPTVSPPDEDGPPAASLELDEDFDRDRDADTPDYDDPPLPQDGDLEADPDEDEDVQPDEPSQPASPTPLAEPEPEPEPEDEDPDLQPAHRAEALDVLATIELKFALLRERVYVERMESLAWEETLVCDGTHPELHHVQNELAKRRDKRLMLASKKRTYEIDAVMKKRREEETWCWEGWDIARTELQTEMIAETNRKRRKLERDRRTIERPPGARRIPSTILNPPPAPTLRQIANTFPVPSHLSHLVANKKSSKGLGVYSSLDGLGGATSYPELSTLSPHDIAADLEFLFQHRRMGYGFGMGFGPPIGVPMGVNVGYNGTSSGFGPPIGFGGPTSTAGFGMNGLGLGAAEGYPPNPGPCITPANGIGGPPLPLGGTGPGLGPGAPLAASSTPSQSTPNAIAAPGSIPGPGIASADGPSFSQPAMGVFQGPPSIGAGPAGYPLGPGGSGASIVIGPGGTTSTPVTGPGGGRIQRPSSFVERDPQRERERELIQREASSKPAGASPFALPYPPAATTSWSASSATPGPRTPVPFPSTFPTLSTPPSRATSTPPYPTPTWTIANATASSCWAAPPQAPPSRRTSPPFIRARFRTSSVFLDIHWTLSQTLACAAKVGPGVVPPMGPGVPGVLSTTSSGPGVTSCGILTSGPGVPPGPGIAPAPSVTGPPGEGNGPSSSLFSMNRTTPLIPYNVPPPVVAVSTQKIGVDGP